LADLEGHRVAPFVQVATTGQVRRGNVNETYWMSALPEPHNRRAELR
jgi:hypothetical protein